MVAFDDSREIAVVMMGLAMPARLERVVREARVACGSKSRKAGICRANEVETSDARLDRLIRAQPLLVESIVEAGVAGGHFVNEVRAERVDLAQAGGLMTEVGGYRSVSREGPRRKS